MSHTDFAVRGIAGEIKLFPPPVCHGELEQWEDLQWQLKRCVGLHRPFAMRMMDDVEGSQRMTADDFE